MSNKCTKCKVSASSRDLLRCYGKCKCAFHPGCIDYKMDTWFKLFRDCPYAKFICLDCQDDLDGDLSMGLECMKETLDTLSSSVQALTTNIDVRFNNVQKDLEEKMNLLHTNVPATPVTLHATTYRDALQSGASKTGSSVPSQPRFQPSLNVIIGSCNDADVAIKSVPDRRYIYASKFANTTTSEDIKKFLSGKLDIPMDDIDCRLLVSTKQDVSSLNYVSFKVGVNPDVFEQLQQPTMWPNGILVREFFSRSKNSISNAVKLL